MKQTELKLCPFCGGEAEIRDCLAYVNNAVLIRCSECFIKTNRILINHPKVTASGTDESTRYTREQAINEAAKMWNRRADNEQREAD